jgi:CRISPR-associated protein Csh1
MIHEIVKFIEYLEENSPEIFQENLKLKEGVYVFLEKESKDLVVKEENVLRVDKNTERNELYEKFLEMKVNTEMINAMKSFNSGPKIYIEIGSPFAISIPYKAVTDKGINKRLSAAEAYFKAAEKYLPDEISKHKEWESEFKKFVLTQVYDLIEEKEYFKKLKKTDTIYFFLKEPSLNDYKKNHQRFLSEKLFNKDKYNIKTNTGKLFGISDELSGFNDKKVFLKHKTAPIELNYRVSGNDAMKLYKFFRLQQQNKILPNPMPVFVDKNELTEEVIKFYKEDKKRGHKEIVEHLIQDKKADLQNYYLLFFQNNLKGSRIIDLDFVPVFKYNTDDMPVVYAIFNVKSKEKGNILQDLNINNIFHFQSSILNTIFNNQLITETKNGLWIKYFDDLDVKPEYGATETIVNLFYKYRKSFYDFIYKSKRQAITQSMFYDIMSNTILDDIKHDKDYDKTFKIKEKLNIWFSFYNYFNNIKNKVDMVNKTKLLFEKTKLIAQTDNEHISNDEEFAFAAGQLIRTILNKSESGERSHAMLEPFLQKTDCEQFKLAVAREFDKYKHAFRFYKGDKNRYAFDKIMSEVMGVETEINMKKLLPYILAGYFSETIFKQDEENNSNNN